MIGKGDEDVRRDVLIVGGGVVGLTLSLALKRALGSDFDVELWDPNLERFSPRQKASAIAPDAQAILDAVGAWDGIDAQPIVQMQISDAKLSDRVRPALLDFEARAEASRKTLAYMICNADLEGRLTRLAAEAGVALRAEAATNVQRDRARARASSASGASVETALVVAADGARSPLREAAGVASIGWGYDRRAIVCTIAHERDHGGTAFQIFFPDGPFAILPLSGRRSSIVWTGESRRLLQLLDGSRGRFSEELQARCGTKLGAVTIADQPLSFEISLNLARTFVAHRLALVGDAAHVIHPLAGQGLNLGLRDASALCAVVADQARAGSDIGELSLLRRYERSRRFETVAMAASTDGLHWLFGMDGPASTLRAFGLGLVNHAGPLKQILTNVATGAEASPRSPLVRRPTRRAVAPRREA